ncbi:4'-phosphopantetheinyl transferase family protein [Curtobacterium poinsettiae]|uniref:4'-phosphopantetheinyl transferase family protein n=1 Tax=Curtobacterium poinsettiae TaxID=159612 RepID=UPI002361C078|nr:4'-phosphopantetheinyl transferase superfamily protein [Curtobacterium flaccumfaciens]
MTRVRRGPLGAPEIDGGARVSVSYTPDAIATAVSHEAPCGIDIEPVDRSLPSGFATPAEEHVWAALDLPPIGLACAKEAIGKALGFGLLAAWDSYRLGDVRRLTAATGLVTLSSFPFVRAVVTTTGTLCLGLATTRTSSADPEPSLVAAVAALRVADGARTSGESARPASR